VGLSGKPEINVRFRVDIRGCGVAYPERHFPTYLSDVLSPPAVHMNPGWLSVGEHASEHESAGMIRRGAIWEGASLFEQFAVLVDLSENGISDKRILLVGELGR